MVLLEDNSFSRPFLFAIVHWLVPRESIPFSYNSHLLKKFLYTFSKEMVTCFHILVT